MLADLYRSSFHVLFFGLVSDQNSGFYSINISTLPLKLAYKNPNKQEKNDLCSPSFQILDFNWKISINSHFKYFLIESKW